MTRTEEIECSIARHWPNFAKICAETGASAAEVHAVVEHLDAIEHQPRTEHDCAHHAPGLACYDEHNCRCKACRFAAQERGRLLMREVYKIPEPVLLLRHAHNIYNVAKSRGEEPPEWAVKGHREWDRLRKRKRWAS